MEAIPVTYRIRLILFLTISILLSALEVYFALSIRNILFIIISLIGLALLLPILATVLALWEEIWIQVIKSFRRRPEKKISPLDKLSSSIFLRRLSNLPIFRNIIRLLAKSLKETALKAGVYTYIEALLALILFSIILLMAITAVSVLILVYIPIIPVLIKIILRILILILPLITIILLISPFLYLQIKKVNRVSEIEDELPFFVVYASIIQEAGLSLYQAFERIVNKGIFKTLESEAKHVIRLFTFFVHSPLEALDEYANFNPNDTLKNIIKGYSSILKSGGEASKYLEETSEKLLEKHVSKWRSYVQTVTTFGEIIIAVFTLFPTLFILGAIAFSQPLSKLFMIMYIAVGVPTVTIIMYALVNQFQPRSRNNFRISGKVVIVGMGLSIGTFYLLNSMTYITDKLTIIVLSVIVFITPLTIASRIVLYEIKSIETALPQFLRDITEYVKIGYDITQAIEKIAETRSYNRLFDKIVRSISMLLKMNVPFSIIAESIETRCWMLKYSLFIISELAMVGALTPRPLERLCSAIEKALHSKYEAKSSLTTYSFLAYITPLFLAILAYFTSSIILGVSTLAGGVAFINVELIKEIIYLTNILTISIAISLGILIAKLRDQTLMNTFHILILLGLVLLALKVPEILSIQFLPLPQMSVKPPITR